MVRKPPSSARLRQCVFRIGLDIGDVNDLAFEQGRPIMRAAPGSIGMSWP